MIFEDLDSPEKFAIRSQVYMELFEGALSLPRIELGIMRHILRQAGVYKIRSILPLLFKNFNKLLPVLRDVVVYINRILTKKVVLNYKYEFEQLLSNDFIGLPYVNMWIYTIFQNDFFNETDIKIDYNKITRIRDQALIAKRQKDTVWVKDYKGNLDTLGFWDKRAVLSAGCILSKDEAKHWMGLEISKGDIVDKAICKEVIRSFL